ncbi:MAG: orotidine-5'-phosphate decarboxylase [Planctomycetia bacterium]|nr:orotidine-5'-phosphate decarboxylase [Planctomycetia bacterium]
MPFCDRLAAAVQQRGNPVLVGLDPRLENIPEPLRRGVERKDRAAAARCYAEFCRGVIDAVAPLVPAVKPQAAFFEQLGPAGMAALYEVIQFAREAGLVVILDGKRNDIGSTAEAYADAYLGEASAWQADAVTVSPYLGQDSLLPFVNVAQARHSGVFVLVKTSNPGGGMFQDVLVEGRPMYARVADVVESLAAKTAGPCGYGCVGAVVGATWPAQLAELRSAMPHTWFLVPGYGSQGGKAADVAPAFDESGLGAIVNNSRGLIFAHERKEFAQFGAAGWQRAVEAAAREMIAELRAHTAAGKLATS